MIDPTYFQDTVKKSIPNSEVYLLDPMNDKTHYLAFVINDDFKNMTLVQQHQKVMSSVKKELDNEVIHALSLRTFTFSSWETSKEKQQMEQQK